MLEYIKKNPMKAVQDVIFIIGLSAMAGMLFFISESFFTALIMNTLILKDL